MCVPVCVLCSFIQSTVDTVLHYLVCVYLNAHIQRTVCCVWAVMWQERWLGADEELCERVFGLRCTAGNEKWKWKWGVRGALVIGGGCHFWWEINNVFLQICLVILGGRFRSGGGNELNSTVCIPTIWTNLNACIHGNVIVMCCPVSDNNQWQTDYDLQPRKTQYL